MELSSVQQTNKKQDFIHNQKLVIQEKGTYPLGYLSDQRDKLKQYQWREGEREEGLKEREMTSIVQVEFSEVMEHLRGYVLQAVRYMSEAQRQNIGEKSKSGSLNHKQ